VIFVNSSNFTGGTKYYKNRSNFPGIKNPSNVAQYRSGTGRIFQEKEKMLRNICKNGFNFLGEGTAPIFQENLFTRTPTIFQENIPPRIAI